MSLEQIDVLLRIKRARERRAIATAARARVAVNRAEAACQQADRAVADYAVRRPAQEAEIYALLRTGPLPSRAIQTAAARLTGLAAYGSVLKQQAQRAGMDHEKAVGIAQEAGRTQTKQSRDVAAADELRGRQTVAAGRDAELAEERLLEALTLPTGRRPGA